MSRTWSKDRGSEIGTGNGQRYLAPLLMAGKEALCMCCMLDCTTESDGSRFVLIKE